VAKTEEKPKKKKPARPKKGLHGWKAALTVFGCGTLAAFGVFGVIIGLLGTLLKATSSGIDAEGSGGDGASSEQIGAARSSLEEGQMDVCSDNIDQLSTIAVTRQDDGTNYIDTTSEGEVGISGASRVVRDECLWTLVPSGGTPWEFSFEYEAVIDNDGGESREDVAYRVYEESIPELPGELSEVSEEGDSSLAENSYHVHGVSASGQSAYIILVYVKSAVYKISFEAQKESAVEEVGLEEFQNQARDLTSFLNQGFTYWIPDE